MTILPPWMRSFGAAGAATNAAAACERRRVEEQAVDARLEAFHKAEQARLAAAARPSPRRAQSVRAA